MKISTDILQILNEAVCTGSQLQLTGNLDRKLYTATNKVLEALGGKWNRKEKAHIFAGDAAEFISDAILTGEVGIAKDEFNYFPTPAPLAERVVNRAGIEPGMNVLEPSAGQGSLCKVILEVPDVVLTACELQQANYNILANVLPEDSSIVLGDFLSVEFPGLFDRIVMNPPFFKQSDIKHVERAFKWLKPGGRLVSIMSAGINFRMDNRTKNFRALVSQSNGTITDLPAGSFKASGTLVNTVLVTMEKG